MFPDGLLLPHLLVVSITEVAQLEKQERYILLTQRSEDRMEES